MNKNAAAFLSRVARKANGNNERESIMGYVIYIGTISTLAFSLLNSALAAIGV